MSGKKNFGKEDTQTIGLWNTEHLKFQYLDFKDLRDGLNPSGCSLLTWITIISVSLALKPDPSFWTDAGEVCYPIYATAIVEARTWGTVIQVDFTVCAHQAFRALAFVILIILNACGIVLARLEFGANIELCKRYVCFISFFIMQVMIYLPTNCMVCIPFGK